MTGCAAIQAQLSDFLDRRLAPDAQDAIRAHLRTCAGCRGVVADLERVIATARELGPIEPPDHVWLEVAGQIHLAGHTAVAPEKHVRPRGPVWQWAGLAAALVAVTLVVWIGTNGSPLSSPAPAASVSTAPATGSIDALAAELDQAQQHSERAIAELMTAAADPSSPVDPAVAMAVQQNMGTIDRAIAESRAALSVNPGSEPARESLFDALRRKISVLQATVSLINQMRQGDQEGAARTAESLGKKS